MGSTEVPHVSRTGNEGNRSCASAQAIGLVRLWTTTAPGGQNPIGRSSPEQAGPRMSPILEALFLFAAGILGGTATSAGAIASLISYPALLAVGIPPLAANVTNAVAVVGTGIASTLASGPELQGTAPRLIRWSLFVTAGAAAGAALLLFTPDELFSWIVPFLVAAAALILLAQPKISAWRTAHRGDAPEPLLPFGLFAVGVYNGYFGAASGIMLLALVLHDGFLPSSSEADSDSRAAGP
jgi:uncharacterized membrane protein YfcA